MTRIPPSLHSLLWGILLAGLVGFGAEGAVAQSVREGVFTEIGIARLPDGSVDVNAYSKLAPWPWAQGDYLYSGCYVRAPLATEMEGAGRCFMVIDVSEPDSPVRVVTRHPFDLEKSPAPPNGHIVWSDDYPFPNLPARAPCRVDWYDRAISAGEKPAPCWDPGWNTQSHYVAVRHDDLLAVNQERWRYGTKRQASWRGVRFYDVRDPERPREVSYWEAPVGATDSETGRIRASGGAHHFNFSGDYLLVGTDYRGYVGRILVILDTSDAANTREIARWALPGQKTPEEDGARDWQQRRLFSRPVERTGPDEKWSAFVGMHYVTVSDEYAFLAYHQSGLVILDVNDMSRPKLVSWNNYLRPGADVSSPNADACRRAAGGIQASCGNTHSAKPIPGTKLLMVEDEYHGFCPTICFPIRSLVMPLSQPRQDILIGIRFAAHQHT